MARNVEIKARLTSEEFARILELLEDRTGAVPQILRQEDTYFACHGERLKLRVIEGQGAELIRYRRPDIRGPRTSDYEVVAVDDPDRCRRELAGRLTVRGTVRKTRRLFTLGRTRVHMDIVDGLGYFLEFEVQLSEEEFPESGAAEAEGLLKWLGVSRAALVPYSYIDLLEGGSDIDAALSL